MEDAPLRVRDANSEKRTSGAEGHRVGLELQARHRGECKLEVGRGRSAGSEAEGSLAAQLDEAADHASTARETDTDREHRADLGFDDSARHTEARQEGGDRAGHARGELPQVPRGQDDAEKGPRAHAVDEPLVPDVQNARVPVAELRRGLQVFSARRQGQARRELSSAAEDDQGSPRLLSGLGRAGERVLEAKPGEPGEVAVGRREHEPVLDRESGEVRVGNKVRANRPFAEQLA